MSLTNTQASVLGRAIMLNASHISRLRNGSRPLPKKPVFLPSMSLYFARHIKEDYQKNILCEKLHLPLWPLDENQSAKVIENWLAGKPNKNADIGPLVSRLSSTQRVSPAETPSGSPLPRIKNYYFGLEGKRTAVLQLFDLILKEKTPQTLLLFSDEEMSWLIDDPSFSARWLSTFTKVLEAGNTVKIVHNIGRDIHELIESVTKWIPVYMTGKIIPYYYPKLRDGVFQNTFFIAPKTAALISSSVNRNTDGMLNELITNKSALAALSMEYENFFSLCRPLLHILSGENRSEIVEIIKTITSPVGDVICMSNAPTLATMPLSVAQSMQNRAPGSHILQVRNTISNQFKGCIEGATYTEILPLEFNSTISLPCGETLGAPGLCYTEEELAQHLDAINDLSSKNKNYLVKKVNDIPSNSLLYVAENQGALMIKNDSPEIGFFISEPNLIYAFWDYLIRK